MFMKDKFIYERNQGMSDNKAKTTPLHDVDNLPDQVNNESVAKFLIDNPMFLIERPELLMNMQINLSENGVVSLTQIQTEQYREKIKQLKSQLNSLVNTARTNEHIYACYASLNIKILETNSISKLISVLEEYLVDALNLEAIKLVLLGQKTQTSNELSEIQQHAIFDKKLAKSNFYLGRLGKLEKQALFPRNQANSVALIQIGDTNPLGLLAVSSTDAVHFNPTMDTMLINFLRQALNVQVSKLMITDAN